MARGTGGRVEVLREDPDLGVDLDAVQLEAATGACTAELVRLPRGPQPKLATDAVDGIGFLVLSGLFIRSVVIDARSGSELLGQGDVLHPWQSEDDATMLAARASWRVLAPARLARLDREFGRRAARWPELTGRLVGRSVQRARHLTINMAIVHNPRIDVRLHLLLWHLAGRWGRVGPGGVTLNLPLTHAVLADLIASRRPTVTSALGDLARRGLLEPVDGGWLLLDEPPNGPRPVP